MQPKNDESVFGGAPTTPWRDFLGNTHHARFLPPPSSPSCPSPMSPTTPSLVICGSEWVTLLHQMNFSLYALQINCLALANAAVKLVLVIILSVIGSFTEFKTAYFFDTTNILVSNNEELSCRLSGPVNTHNLRLTLTNLPLVHIVCATLLGSRI